MCLASKISRSLFFLSTLSILSCEAKKSQSILQGHQTGYCLTSDQYLMHHREAQSSSSYTSMPANLFLKLNWQANSFHNINLHHCKDIHSKWIMTMQTGNWALLARRVKFSSQSFTMRAVATCLLYCLWCRKGVWLRFHSFPNTWSFIRHEYQCIVVLPQEFMYYSGTLRVL